MEIYPNNYLVQKESKVDEGEYIFFYNITNDRYTAVTNTCNM